MRGTFLTLLLVGVLAGISPPTAAQDAALAADQFRSANNLKLIGLALHNYEAVNRHFPNNVYKDGKALLSWRVLILPYVEQQDALFKKFKLDEPWDSPANKALAGEMPKLYAPVRGAAKAGETFYRGFVTPRGPFGPKAGRGSAVAGFTDGLSNTGLVFEAGEPVVWTRPDDLVLPEKGPLPKLGGMFGGVAQVLLADGSVVRLRAAPDPAELRKLIEPADGYPVDFGKLRAK